MAFDKQGIWAQLNQSIGKQEGAVCAGILIRLQLVAFSMWLVVEAVQFIRTNTPFSKVETIIVAVALLLMLGHIYLVWRSEFTWRLAVALSIVPVCIWGVAYRGLPTEFIPISAVGSLLLLSIGCRRRGWPKVA